MVEGMGVTDFGIAEKEKPMANPHEKRNSSRHTVGGPITLHPTIRASRDINAHLLNFSEQGICFSTDKQLIPGTTLLFKASKDNYLSADRDDDCQLRSISLVTVKWCHESAKQDQPQPIHIIGANYIIPPY
ncbi:hypothetical protein [Desulfosarcina sp.]|uniref:hypothetical protein n=1 Tax=Desulfosarcina sp. TaxID=2027861 RepID=UPI00356B60A6